MKRNVNYENKTVWPETLTPGGKPIAALKVVVKVPNLLFFRRHDVSTEAREIKSNFCRLPTFASSIKKHC